ncbi:MAG TPA: hypothetical protein VNH18_32805 [Bryobacteraceae bacterium]|jgi:ElaB/YqjD/DUF883 family membrane-anchored ribosome-binding protein|nr:hypothetical protein [Bryobacteraceae bacterium]
METVGSNNDFGKQTQDLADKAAEKVQSGIRTAKDTTNQVADRLSDTVEAARSSAGPRLAKAADRVQSVANQTRDSFGAATRKVRATAADVGDSVISYTRDNPVKAILISAAVGALIGALATTLPRSSD